MWNKFPPCSSSSSSTVFPSQCAGFHRRSESKSQSSRSINGTLFLAWPPLPFVLELFSGTGGRGFTAPGWWRIGMWQPPTTYRHSGHNGKLQSITVRLARLVRALVRILTLKITTLPWTACSDGGTDWRDSFRAATDSPSASPGEESTKKKRKENEVHIRSRKRSANGWRCNGAGLLKSKFINQTPNKPSYPFLWSAKYTFRRFSWNVHTWRYAIRIEKQLMCEDIASKTRVCFLFVFFSVKLTGWITVERSLIVNRESIKMILAKPLFYYFFFKLKQYNRMFLATNCPIKDFSSCLSNTWSICLLASSST